MNAIVHKTCLCEMGFRTRSVKVTTVRRESVYVRGAERERVQNVTLLIPYRILIYILCIKVAIKLGLRILTEVTQFPYIRIALS